MVSLGDGIGEMRKEGKSEEEIQQYLEEQEARKLELEGPQEDTQMPENEGELEQWPYVEEPPLKRQKTTTEEEKEKSDESDSGKSDSGKEKKSDSGQEKKSDWWKEKDPKMREWQRWREALSCLATEHHRVEWMPEHLCEEGQEPTLWVLSKNDEWVETTITKSFMKKEGCCDVCDRRL
jgi:hypothetical protein